MRTSALFGVNLRIFRNLRCVSTDKGVVQCGHFADKEGSQFFAILYGCLLWTAPFVFVFEILKNKNTCNGCCNHAQAVT